MTDDHDRKNPNRPDATDVFHNMPTRLVGEQEDRNEQAARSLSFYQPFLDDVLRGIAPHEFILLGAPSGLGKTDLAVAIAMANALKEFRVGIFALEAEVRELERRIKFGWISDQAWRRRVENVGRLNYSDWYFGKCKDIVGELDAEADHWIRRNLSTLWTFYRGAHFDAENLCDQIRKHRSMLDLVIVDHLHYIDFNGSENEHQAMGDMVKLMRDTALDLGIPVLLVAHLRKRDMRLKQVVPSLDDFHGSSNIAKICTQAITIERASSIEAPKWWFAPTFMSVLKDRRSGAPPYVALTMFDKRTRRYEETYALGRVIKGGTEWVPLKAGEAAPGWANGHRQLEMNVG